MDPVYRPQLWNMNAIATNATAAAGTAEEEEEDPSSSETEDEDLAEYVSMNTDPTMTTHRRRRPRELPTAAVTLLKAWFFAPENVTHPYPTPAEQILLRQQTGLEKTQLKNWFVNARRRIWKPVLTTGEGERQQREDDTTPPPTEPKTKSRGRSNSTDRRRCRASMSRQSFVAARERKRKAQDRRSEEEEEEDSAGSTTDDTDTGGSTVRANDSSSSTPSFQNFAAAARTFRPSPSQRQERNAREQARSFRIAQQIEELRALLVRGGVPMRTGTKSAVLIETAQYIRRLQQQQQQATTTIKERAPQKEEEREEEKRNTGAPPQHTPNEYTVDEQELQTAYESLHPVDTAYVAAITEEIQTKPAHMTTATTTTTGPPTLDYEEYHATAERWSHSGQAFRNAQERLHQAPNNNCAPPRDALHVVYVHELEHAHRRLLAHCVTLETQLAYCQHLVSMPTPIPAAVTAIAAPVPAAMRAMSSSTAPSRASSSTAATKKKGVKRKAPQTGVSRGQEQKQPWKTRRPSVFPQRLYDLLQKMDQEITTRATTKDGADDTTIGTIPMTADANTMLAWRQYNIIHQRSSALASSSSFVDHPDDVNTILKWMPDGLAFRVFLEHHEESTIVQLFQANNFILSKYKSFTKQLALYHFTRHRKGIYSHPLFQRGRPELFYNKSMKDFEHAATGMGGGGGGKLSSWSL